MADEKPAVLDCARGVYPEKPVETPLETFRRERGELSRAMAHGVVAQVDILRVLALAEALIPSESVPEPVVAAAPAVEPEKPAKAAKKK